MEKKSKYWRRLDNAAKLFTAASTKRDTRVFRFYCELKEEVRPEVLQQAVEMAVGTYPLFLSVMRKGMFWNYLERSELRPVVRAEYKEPCSRLYFKDKNALLFEVTYYKNRINFEAFHVLTDGTGAIAFLRELVSDYLYLAHQEEGLAPITLVPDDVTVQDHEVDSFTKYYSPELGKRKQVKLQAHVLKKVRRENGQLQVGEREVSVKNIVERSRELGVSVSVFITTVLLLAIHEEMTKVQERYPVVLMVPVNLRNFFSSESMLNFFNWILPKHKFGEGDDSFEAVLTEVKGYFKEELTQEKMARRMSELISLEVHPVLRFAPADLKNLCIHAGAKFSERESTAVFSNMGPIVLPDSYASYIERFGCFTSTPKLELCVISFQDKMSFGFTSRFDTDNIQRNFYRILEEQKVASGVIEPDFPEPEVPSNLEMTVYKSYTLACLALVLFMAIVGVNLHGQAVAGAADKTAATAKVMTVARALLFAAGGVASMWVASSIGFFKRHNLFKNAVWQLVVVSVASVIWDFATGWRGWSVDYVIPGVSAAVLLTLIVLARVQRRMPREYMFYFMFTACYGMVLPFILVMTGILHMTWVCMICSASCLLFLVWLVSFKGREFREEMQKKFHV